MGSVTDRSSGSSVTDGSSEGSVTDRSSGSYVTHHGLYMTSHIPNIFASSESLSHVYIPTVCVCVCVLGAGWRAWQTVALVIKGDPSTRHVLQHSLQQGKHRRGETLIPKTLGEDGGQDTVTLGKTHGQCASVVSMRPQLISQYISIPRVKINMSSFIYPLTLSGEHLGLCIG